MEAITKVLRRVVSSSALKRSKRACNCGVNYVCGENCAYSDHDKAPAAKPPTKTTGTCGCKCGGGDSAHACSCGPGQCLCNGKSTDSGAAACCAPSKTTPAAAAATTTEPCSCAAGKCRCHQAAGGPACCGATAASSGCKPPTTTDTPICAAAAGVLGPGAVVLLRIPATDLARAEAFYTNVLGWDFPRTEELCVHAAGKEPGDVRYFVEGAGTAEGGGGCCGDKGGCSAGTCCTGGCGCGCGCGCGKGAGEKKEKEKDKSKNKAACCNAGCGCGCGKAPPRGPPVVAGMLVKTDAGEKQAQPGVVPYLRVRGSQRLDAVLAKVVEVGGVVRKGAWSDGRCAVQYALFEDSEGNVLGLVAVGGKQEEEGKGKGKAVGAAAADEGKVPDAGKADKGAKDAPLGSLKEVEEAAE